MNGEIGIIIKINKTLCAPDEVTIKYPNIFMQVQQLWTYQLARTVYLAPTVYMFREF
jgi:hypothetical protein